MQDALPTSRKEFAKTLFRSATVVTAGFLIRDALIGTVQLALAIVIGVITGLFRYRFDFGAVLSTGKATEVASQMTAAVLFMAVAYDINFYLAPPV